MSDNSTRGLFVWHDLMSTDHESAQKFYETLFDWHVDVVDMGEQIGKYSMLKSGEDQIGGIVPLDASHGHPSHWISYITVDDVDASCNLMKTLGGDIPYAPFDIPDVGRTAVAQDSTGAYFSPFKGISEADTNPPTPRAGVFTWHELLTKDVNKATSFYTEVMGWGIGSMDMGPAGTYWLFKKNDRDIAGAVQMPADAGDSPSNWLPYVGVTDVPAIAQQTKDLGGKIFVEPRQVGDPVNVHFAVLSAPDGSMFGVVEV